LVAAAGFRCGYSVPKAIDDLVAVRIRRPIGLRDGEVVGGRDAHEGCVAVLRLAAHAASHRVVIGLAPSRDLACGFQEATAERPLNINLIAAIEPPW
jgi:hypothetical protein